MKKPIKANLDIRSYMEDNGVLQKQIAEKMGVHYSRVCNILSKELPESKKEELIRIIDSIADCKKGEEQEAVQEQVPEEPNVQKTNSARFRIGDRVKIPSKSMKIGTVADIWKSIAQGSTMYAVETEDGNRCLYSEAQLEPAPIPITYRFEVTVEGNVAVCVMFARQGEKEFVYARGHAHVLHDGEVGLAQAVSFAAKRMFETVDTKCDSKIYLKGGKENGKI